MAIHTDSQLHTGQFGKAAYAGWILFGRQSAEEDEGGVPGSNPDTDVVRGPWNALT
jgi:hypothetical protein